MTVRESDNVLALRAVSLLRRLITLYLATGVHPKAIKVRFGKDASQALASTSARSSLDATCYRPSKPLAQCRSVDIFLISQDRVAVELRL